MKSEIVRYRAGDIAAMRLRADFIGGHVSVELNGSFTLLRDGAFVVGCGGWVEDRAGVFTLWGRCQDDLTGREWVKIRNHIREMIRDLNENGGACRVQSYCYASDEKARGFLRQIGLHDETHVLKAFGPNGSDFLIAAQLRAA